ncbi:MAG: ABC transporter ATP-binding protein [Geminicoccales bacterium]
MAAIVASELTKNFETRRAGDGGWIDRWIRPATETVPAVKGISFTIDQGERVAFIGPNGAGKSTTLKMLTGILLPSGGRAEVAGLVPWAERRRLAYRIGIVFGQRSQLWYHLPVRDSFELLSRLYDVEQDAYRQRLADLASNFAIEDLLERRVAELSLGQRLRCEIAASLIHAPDILFLDEPTIGLDVEAKSALRDYLRALSDKDGTTVLLTSHDTGDIEHMAERVIVIDRGNLLLDEPLQELRASLRHLRVLVLTTKETTPVLELPGTTVTGQAPYRLTLTIDTRIQPVETVIRSALNSLTVQDIAVESPPLDDIVKAIYRGEIGRDVDHATA